MTQIVDILIIGAGATGLMTARELAKAGKKVIIVEARDRIGGRIHPIPKDVFGYEAQLGAEFVHGEAKVTKALMKEAGLTFIPESGEIWTVRSGELMKAQSFVPSNKLFRERLQQLTEDISVAAFLQKYFSGKEYDVLRNEITKVVEGYDAADSTLISTLELRNEWLGNNDLEGGVIKEGYGALLNFLKSECLKYGVEIHLNEKVERVVYDTENTKVTISNGTEYVARKIVVTVAIPTLSSIQFTPPITQKIQAASKIGFGSVVKGILQFKERWWLNGLGEDLSKLSFLLSNEKFCTVWTQYPETYPTLTVWSAGPIAQTLAKASETEIFEEVLISLSNIFKIDKEAIRQQVVVSRFANWPADPFTQGAYSYTRFDTGTAYEKLAEPINDMIFFAGEALYTGKDTATVEGALANGKETAERILRST